MPSDYTDGDRARRVAETPKSQYRTAFERDRARLVHSAALRRLGAKTQVLVPASDDFVRTRLTHTLEVAQVGRALAKALGCDPDVVDTACLAHDLGHPPYGHNGERALAAVTVAIGGFEGNAQTFRLLTRLEPKVVDPVTGAGAGLNLTRASLDASLKYPWAAADAPAGPDGAPSGKFGVYADDADVFGWVRSGAPTGQRCLEAQVMDLADDISYSVHDVEDAVVGGRFDLAALDDPGVRVQVREHVLSWYGSLVPDELLDRAMSRLPALPTWVRGFDGSRRGLAALKDMTSDLIGRFCQAAIDATREQYGPGRLVRYGADLVVPDATLAEILVLKGLAVTFVMAPREAEPLHGRQREVLEVLVRALSARPELMEPPFVADWESASDDDVRLRVVVDQVASLTDVSAADWYLQLTGRPS